MSIKTPPHTGYTRGFEKYEFEGDWAVREILDCTPSQGARLAQIGTNAQKNIHLSPFFKFQL